MNWSFKNLHVQSDITDSNFVSSESSLIAGGPPDWTGDIMSVVPMGIVENYQVTTTVMTNQIFEIGSRLFYIVHGRSWGNITISRVFYNGPSLLSVLYGAFTFTLSGDTSSNGTISPISSNVKVTPSSGTSLPSSSQGTIRGDIAPGTPLSNGGFFGWNLGSELFQSPTGILLFFEDTTGNPVGGTYLEHCYITGHQFANSSGQLVIGEGVSLTFVQQTPILFVNPSGNTTRTGTPSITL